MFQCLRFEAQAFNFFFSGSVCHPPFQCIHVQTYTAYGSWLRQNNWIKSRMRLYFCWSQHEKKNHSKIVVRCVTLTEKIASISNIEEIEEKINSSLLATNSDISVRSSLVVVVLSLEMAILRSTQNRIGVWSIIFRQLFPFIIGIIDVNWKSHHCILSHIQTLTQPYKKKWHVKLLIRRIFGLFISFFSLQLSFHFSAL